MKFKTGLENLNPDHLKGKVSIITNSTGVTQNLEQNVDMLIRKGVSIKEILAPEHGFYTAFKNGENVTDEEYKNIPVKSIYTEPRHPLSAKKLEDVLTIIYDLQDAGSRPYTHISILKELLIAAKESGSKVIICDRPAPLNGNTIEGPMIEEKYLSFIGIEKVPLRYGMTIGEMAVFINRKINADLEISKMSGYSRKGYYDDYMRYFVPPSLNLSSLESVINFSGLVLLEATKTSVGRGTPYPFKQFGFPEWLKLPKKIDGAVLRETKFVPNLDPYKDVMLKGFFIHIIEREKYSSIDLSIKILKELFKIDSEQIDVKHMCKLYGSDKFLNHLEEEDRIRDIKNEWKEESLEYMEERQNSLLYE